MEEIPVVTCFLRHEGKLLLLRRSDAVGSYPGRWGAVAGHVAASDGDPTAPEREPIDAGREEIAEETGIETATLVRAGDPFVVEDSDRGTRWCVHPFLFDVETSSLGEDVTVATDAETSEYAWVHAPEIRRRETVPDLWTSYDRVRPRVATVREDTTHGSASLSLRALEVLRDEAALASDAAAPDGDERAGNDWEALAAVARDLRDARPSMVVIANRVNRAMACAADAGRTPAAVEATATEGIDLAVRVDDAAAVNAADELPEYVATLSRSGTVRRALLSAEPASILVAESRPGGEGVEVAETLSTALPATDVTLTTDAAFVAELARENVSAIVVGADRILPDGRVVNKVGTRAAALSAPPACRVLVVASTDKVAVDDAVDRERRDPNELYDGDASLSVANPTFDVTPADAVDAVVTEDGVRSPAAVEAVADEHRERADW